MALKDEKSKLCNSALNPCSRSVYHIHTEWLSSTWGKAWSSSEPLDKLKEKIEAYEKEGKHFLKIVLKMIQQLLI